MRVRMRLSMSEDEGEDESEDEDEDEDDHYGAADAVAYAVSESKETIAPNDNESGSDVDNVDTNDDESVNNDAGNVEPNDTAKPVSDNETMEVENEDQGQLKEGETGEDGGTIGGEVSAEQHDSINQEGQNESENGPNDEEETPTSKKRTRKNNDSVQTVLSPARKSARLEEKKTS